VELSAEKEDPWAEKEGGTGHKSPMSLKFANKTQKM